MHRYPMVPHPSEQLMTVEEAERLSRLDGGYDSGEREARRAPALWAWASVEGVIAGTISDEQVDRVIASKRKR